MEDKSIEEKIRDYYKDTQTEDLIKKYRGLDEAIHGEYSSFGTRDVIMFCNIESELLRRGCRFGSREILLPENEEEVD